MIARTPAAVARDRSESPAAGLSTGWLLGALAVGGVVLFTLPLLALFGRTPWLELFDLLTGPVTAPALRLSLITSSAAVLLSLVAGLPLAWVLARVRFRGRRLIRALVILPMVLPPVVAGVALLAAFGRNGAFGEVLAVFGISLPFTTVGVTIAQAFVAAPFLVVTLEAGFASADRRLEDAAATLGARRWMIWRSILLPAVRPSLLAGIALCWARALGEFGATIAFAGNLRGRTQTLPLAVYEQLQTNLASAIALSLVLVAASLTLITGLHARLFATR